MSEGVILLHGLGRTHRSMRKLQRVLTAESYTVWNRSYPSTRQSVETSAMTHIKTGLQVCSEQKLSRIHFVTHSLGGILLRYYLQHSVIEHLGNIVMLSPPNHGSEVADKFRHHFFYRWMTGPAGQQLGTDVNSLPQRLKPCAATIGVITGRRSSDPWFNHFMPRPHDGKVTAASAQLQEMSDFRLVDCGHTFIMNDAFVIRQILYFLNNGSFEASADRKGFCT